MKTKLYIGNLGDDGRVTSDDLRPLFEQFGNVTECECIKNYAFVHMEDDKSAFAAVQSLNGTVVKGRNIKVEKSESRGPRKPSQKLFVGNIAEGTTNEELKAVFEEFTPVLEADVIKNYGFVHIDAEAGRAKINEIVKELNGYNLNGSNIRVQMSTSGVRQKPGMGGDQCYRCGKEGHWSKECPTYPDHPGGGFGGPRGGGGGYPRGGSSGRGGPVRSGPPYGGRAGQNTYRGDPYPTPPPPSYVRERMMGSGAPSYSNPMYGGNGPQSGGGYQQNMPQQSAPMNRGGPMNDPYARGGAPSQPPVQDMYDRRPGPYGGPPNMGGGRDIGGPMRGPDYGQPSYGVSSDPYRSNMSNSGYVAAAPGPYQSHQQQQPPIGGYSTSGSNFGGPVGGGYSTTGGGGYGAPNSAYSTPAAPYGAPQGGSDMFSRRSPGPGIGMGAPMRTMQGSGGYGGPSSAPMGRPGAGYGQPSHSGNFGGSGRGDYRMY